MLKILQGLWFLLPMLSAPTAMACPSAARVASAEMEAHRLWGPDSASAMRWTRAEVVAAIAPMPGFLGVACSRAPCLAVLTPPAGTSPQDLSRELITALPGVMPRLRFVQRPICNATILVIADGHGPVPLLDERIELLERHLFSR